MAILKKVRCIHLTFATRTLSGVSNLEGLVKVMSKFVMVCPQLKDYQLFFTSQHMVMVCGVVIGVLDWGLSGAIGSAFGSKSYLSNPKVVN